MNAPEKIYLFENPITETPDNRWLSKRSDDTDIEYTRTDTFIEKAWDWIEKNIKDYIIVDIDNKYEVVDGLFYEDFRNFMKGE